MEGVWYVVSRLRIGADRQKFGCSANDHRRSRRVPRNGINVLDATIHVISGEAYAELRQFDDAWRSIDEVIAAVQATKERLCEAEVHRVVGEIVLLSPERNVAKAEAYFERALAVARQQQAKSWELRVATSLARLWRDQGKSQQARELLTLVYGWFTEGFDTRDLKEAKTLLDTLAA